MNLSPLDLGALHFVGIGGIGMSGIAEILHHLGQKVQGSDIAESANVQRLKALGIPIHIGHKADHIDDHVTALVVSSDIPFENVEVAEARRRGIPIVRRAEMLGEIARLKWTIAISGTHGKTTTTSIIDAVLSAAELEPTVVNGGIINDYGTNARLGKGNWMVVEADESDGSFTAIPSTIAVVTNMDPEHMAFYGSFDEVRLAYQKFIQDLPFYGFAILCQDHPEVRALKSRIDGRRVVSYGLAADADVQGVNIRFEKTGSTFDVIFHKPGAISQFPTELKDIFLPLVGKHNVQNTLAAIAIAHELGLPEESLRKALQTFQGVKRRFTRTGEVDGVLFVDDYAHHPVELDAVFKAARQVTDGRIFAVIQPHRYSRVQDLFEDFCASFEAADRLFLAPIYAAGEAPIPGVTTEAIMERLQERGHIQPALVRSPEELVPYLAAEAQPGDVVLCMGAGTITKWAHDLPALFQAVRHP